MTLNPLSVLVIIGMAVATYLTHIGGVLVFGRLNLQGRAKAAFDAIPPAVLMAVIAPIVFASGWRETVAAGVTALAATRLPLLLTVAIGVLTVVVLRAFV